MHKTIIFNEWSICNRETGHICEIIYKSVLYVYTDFKNREICMSYSMKKAHFCFWCDFWIDFNRLFWHFKISLLFILFVTQWIWTIFHLLYDILYNTIRGTLSLNIKALSNEFTKIIKSSFLKKWEKFLILI